MISTIDLTSLGLNGGNTGTTLTTGTSNSIKNTSSAIQIGSSITPANNLTIDASANDGTALIGFGTAPGGIVTQVMKMLASGAVQFPAGVTMGPLGSGTGVVTNANGTAIQLGQGYILQFGSVSNTNNLGSGYSQVTLPVNFPNAGLCVFIGALTSSSSSYAAFFANVENASLNTHTFNWLARTAASAACATGTLSIYWIAIGN